MAIKQMKSAVDREITAKTADSTAWLAAYKKLRDEIKEEINNAEVVSF
jgi:flagellar basal body-associated protein FliL